MGSNLIKMVPKNINKIVIDGSNIAYFSKIGRKADINNIIILLGHLRLLQKERPAIKFEIVCDAGLKNGISNKSCYEKCCAMGPFEKFLHGIRLTNILLK
jgi:hypothetical protein